MMHTRRTLLISGLCLLVVGLTLVLDRRDKTAGVVAHDLDAKKGVRANDGRSPVGESDADPANLRQSEWSIGQETTEEYRDISRWGADPLNELEEGDAAWLDVAVSLNDPRAAREDWVGCKQAWIDQPCAYELQMVAEPTGEDGEIVYTRGVVPEDSNPGCAEFAACMAKARLGQRIEGLRGGPRGLIMTGTAARPDPDFEDPEALRRMIEVLEDDLEAAESMENGDPMFEFRRRVQALVVQMWKEELAAM